MNIQVHPQPRAYWKIKPANLDAFGTDHEMYAVLGELTTPSSWPSPPPEDIGSSYTHEPSPMFHTPDLLKFPAFLSLPKNIKPLTTRVAVDDLAFLHSRGALKLPPEESRDELLWCFFEYVHPLMPILDVETFLNTIQNPDGSAGQISLLLLQAVLFAGTAFVKLDLIRRAGFSTRRQARKAFLHKTRLLYDFNTETDRLVLVQVLTLMSLWYESPEEHRNTWHWTDVAISQCYAAGLHLDPSFSGTQESPQTQGLRRRLWWTCFIRDRIVSMGMRRSPRIKDDDYNVLMLVSSDFYQPNKDRGSLERLCSYANHPKKSADLAEVCILQASLCRCLRQNMHTHYTIFSENGGEGDGERFRLPNYHNDTSFIICSEQLLLWRETSIESCQRSELLPDIESSGIATVFLNRKLLDMTYYAAVATINRSRFIALLDDPQASLFDRESAKLNMQNAASRISSAAAKIHEYSLDLCLPAMAVTIVVSAASIHLLELKGVIQADEDRAQEGFRQCMLVIESLKDMYVVADLAKDAMEWAFVNHLSAYRTPSSCTTSVFTSKDNYESQGTCSLLNRFPSIFSETSSMEESALARVLLEGTEGLEVLDNSFITT
ncbi:hypothetical protein NW762_010697 [Fusarium torreyae]|uniref:Xylanolytic transcriptional activator regulatory domain-containing protein n=1 Tax=Fusarium torreyae TaxID=1237075 RepID=A0A9W8RQT0_9HYPO|nr:hypothetical protein NW762_010697 [Fusarium torreyae]